MTGSTLPRGRSVRGHDEVVLIDITVASDDGPWSTPDGSEHQRDRGLGVALLALGAGLAVSSLLGPLAFDVIRYHASDSLRNQTIGIDAMILAVVAPTCLLLGWLHLRGTTLLDSSGAAALSLAPGLFAAYMVPQYVIGPDYVGLPGNNHRFFLLHLALFVLAVIVSLISWNAIEPDDLPQTTRRTDRIAAAVLIVGAAFLVFGLHLPGVIDGLHRTQSERAFLDDPTAFWFVKFLDLGIIVPASILGGVSLAKRLPGAHRLMYALVGWLTLDAIAVFSMAVTMDVNDDPNASRVLAAGFAGLCIALIALATALIRPLLIRRSQTSRG